MQTEWNGRTQQSCKGAQIQMRHFWEDYLHEVLANQYLWKVCDWLVLHAGPDLTDAKLKANPLVRSPHPLLWEKKESVNQFAKIGELCSESAVIKKFSIIAEVPTITAFVAAFDAKALNCTELLDSYLAGMNRIINCHRQTISDTHEQNTSRKTHRNGCNC